jgi:dihydrofolate reductase
MGKKLLVGKNTTLPPLPGREVVRLSREDILPLDAKDVILIGGKTLIDRLSHLPYWTRWYLTVIEFPEPIKADTYLYPDLSLWTLVEERVEKGWCRKNHCPVMLYFRVYER